VCILWLQMCWHRQRIVIPGHKASLPSLTAYHHLRFTYCGKVLGYLSVDNDSILCQSCYDEFPPIFDKSFYIPLYYHFVSDGLLKPTALCYLCSDSVLTLRTFRECNICAQEHLQFLTIIEEQGEDINDYGDPIILYIEGEQIDF